MRAAACRIFSTHGRNNRATGLGDERRLRVRKRPSNLRPHRRRVSNDDQGPDSTDRSEDTRAVRADYSAERASSTIGGNAESDPLTGFATSPHV